MKPLFKFQNIPSNDLAALSARLIAGGVLFPHGAQKLLGWWGGHGFNDTMHYFTDTVGLPYLLGLPVILIEFFVSILLVLGLFTRLSAAIILLVMTGIIVTVQHHYFFMNWFGTQQGEGMEFFILMIGLCLVCIFHGGGKFALDHYLVRPVK
jgi:putative oxidoreductase